jgi:hypothetical protein
LFPQIHSGKPFVSLTLISSSFLRSYWPTFMSLESPCLAARWSWLMHVSFLSSPDRQPVFLG